MSLAAAHESRRMRRACQHCLGRKARFSYRGTVRADRNHTLCFACFRAERERQRARRLAEVVPGPSDALRPLRPPLNARQMAHRRTMLAHLGRQRVPG